MPFKRAAGAGPVSIDGDQEEIKDEQKQNEGNSNNVMGRETLEGLRRARHEQPKSLSVSAIPLRHTSATARRHEFDRSVGRFTREEQRENEQDGIRSNWRNNLFSKLQHE